MYVCMYACMYVYIYICIYVYVRIYIRVGIQGVYRDIESIGEEGFIGVAQDVYPIL